MSKWSGNTDTDTTNTILQHANSFPAFIVIGQKKAIY